MTLKVSTSSVEWFFFTWYGRKVDFFSIECRKVKNIGIIPFPVPYFYYINYITLHQGEVTSTSMLKTTNAAIESKIYAFRIILMESRFVWNIGMNQCMCTQTNTLSPNQLQSHYLKIGNQKKQKKNSTLKRFLNYTLKDKKD